ncbi:MAG: cytochrome c maturation protein CcmE [Sphingobacteriia bacterium]|nr:cytochrome c maturation protein CcmE [Sphingobacteriia bacterium]
MKKKYKRLLSLLIFLALFGSGLTLVLVQFKENIIFFYTPSELKNQTNLFNKEMRIGGLIEEGSIKNASHSNEFHIFVITDEEAKISVKYKGILPALFRENQGVVARGKLINSSEFLASEILTKHDEKYIPKELEDKLKEKGYFKDEK